MRKKVYKRYEGSKWGRGRKGGGGAGWYYIVNFVSISKVCRISFPLYILRIPLFPALISNKTKTYDH